MNLPLKSPPKPIDRSVPNPKDMNWEALVKEGMATLQALSGHVWTDYNEHDPGVTLLEALAYALTDIGYRASLPLVDLITDEHGKIDLDGACLFTPPRIFPCAPVTLVDLRKVLLDQLQGLANAWIVPSAIPGRYRVWLLAAPTGMGPAAAPAGAGTPDPSPDSLLSGAAAQCLSRYRTLGDFFEKPGVVQTQRFTLDFTVRVSLELSCEQIYRNIRTSISHALAPPIPFQPHPAPGEDATPPEELFEGPLLSRGILRDEDLWEPWDRRCLEDSSLLRDVVADALLAAEGVEELVELKTPSFVGPTVPKDVPLVFEWDPSVRGNHVFLEQGSLLWSLSKALLNMPMPAPPRAINSTELLGAWDDSVQTGTFVDVRRYDPIQDSLPPVYGLEKDALPAEASPRRIAQVKQLRAYLFVFEQLLANACAQLAHLPRLLSCHGPVSAYAWQPLYALEGADTLLKGTLEVDGRAEPDGARAARKAYQDDPANPYATGMRAIVQDWNEAFGQPEAFLDHLLARFAESLPRLDWQNFETAEQKRRFLASYPELSANRHRAFDLERARRGGIKDFDRSSGPLARSSERRTLLTAEYESDAGLNVSWLERKVNLLLAAGPRMPLGTYPPPAPEETDAAGTPPFKPYRGRAYYLVEHPLFLGDVKGSASKSPDEDKDKAPDGVEVEEVPKDFFVLRVTHVLTNWTWFPLDLALPPNFVTYVEDFIRQSAPAHLEHEFLWLTPEQMEEFTRLMRRWYEDKLPVLEVEGEQGDSYVVSKSGSAYELVSWLLPPPRKTEGG